MHFMLPIHLRIICVNLTDGDCLIGEVEVVVAGPSCDRSREVTDVCSGTESSVSPNNDMSEKHDKKERYCK